MTTKKRPLITIVDARPMDAPSFQGLSPTQVNNGNNFSNEIRRPEKIPNINSSSSKTLQENQVQSAPPKPAARKSLISASYQTIFPPPETLPSPAFEKTSSNTPSSPFNTKLGTGTPSSLNSPSITSPTFPSNTPRKLVTQTSESNLTTEALSSSSRTPPRPMPRALSSIPVDREVSNDSDYGRNKISSGDNLTTFLNVEIEDNAINEKLLMRTKSVDHDVTENNDLNGTQIDELNVIKRDEPNATKGDVVRRFRPTIIRAKSTIGDNILEGGNANVTTVNINLNKDAAEKADNKIKNNANNNIKNIMSNNENNIVNNIIANKNVNNENNNINNGSSNNVNNYTDNNKINNVTNNNANNNINDKTKKQITIIKAKSEDKNLVEIDGAKKPKPPILAKKKPLLLQSSSEEDKGLNKSPKFIEELPKPNQKPPKPNQGPPKPIRPAAKKNYPLPKTINQDTKTVGGSIFYSPPADIQNIESPQKKTLPARSNLDKFLKNDVEVNCTIGPRAVALYDFESGERDELNFKKGDIIKVTRWVNNDWLEGCIKTSTGIFPLVLVDLIEAPPISNQAPPISIETPPISSTNSDLPNNNDGHANKPNNNERYAKKPNNNEGHSYEPNNNEGHSNLLNNNEGHANKTNNNKGYANKLNNNEEQTSGRNEASMNSAEPIYSPINRSALSSSKEDNSILKDIKEYNNGSIKNKILTNSLEMNSSSELPNLSNSVGGVDGENVTPGCDELVSNLIRNTDLKESMVSSDVLTTESVGSAVNRDEAMHRTSNLDASTKKDLDVEQRNNLGNVTKSELKLVTNGFTTAADFRGGNGSEMSTDKENIWCLDDVSGENGYETRTEKIIVGSLTNLSGRNKFDARFEDHNGTSNNVVGNKSEATIKKKSEYFKEDINGGKEFEIPSKQGNIESIMNLIDKSDVRFENNNVETVGNNESGATIKKKSEYLEEDMNGGNEFETPIPERGNIGSITNLINKSDVRFENNIEKVGNNKSVAKMENKIDSNFGIICVAEFDYSSDEATDLCFCEGEEILLVKKLNEDWGEGLVGCKRGIFPLAFVSITDRTKVIEESNGNSSTLNRIYVEAIFDFESRLDGDLSFKVGEIIEVTQEIGEWMNGEVGLRKGLFPANFVKKLNATDF